MVSGSQSFTSALRRIRFVCLHSKFAAGSDSHLKAVTDRITATAVAVATLDAIAVGLIAQTMLIK
jgi:hypothetical protein